MWRETRNAKAEIARAEISIHSLRVEGDRSALHREDRYHISIHSLRVEGDVKTVYDIMTDTISIHSLRVEGDRQGTDNSIRK